MKTKEQAKKQAERIIHRLVYRLNPDEFKARAQQVLNYVHKTYCQR